MSSYIVRLPDVIRLTGLKKSTIYELMRKGEFPQSFALGCRAVGWGERDVAMWVEERRATQRQSPSTPRNCAASESAPRTTDLENCNE